MTFTGDRGKLKVGFQVAAILGPWSLTHKQETLGAVPADLSAKAASTDRFWCTQKVTEVGLWMGKAWWVWTNPVVQFDDRGNIEAKLVGSPVARLNF